MCEFWPIGISYCEGEKMDSQGTFICWLSAGLKSRRKYLNFGLQGLVLFKSCKILFLILDLRLWVNLWQNVSFKA